MGDRRAKVPCACSSCATRKQTCDNFRPCLRCVRLGLESTCRDRTAKQQQQQKEEGSPGVAMPTATVPNSYSVQTRMDSLKTTLELIDSYLADWSKEDPMSASLVFCSSLVRSHINDLFGLPESKARTTNLTLESAGVLRPKLESRTMLTTSMPCPALYWYRNTYNENYFFCNDLLASILDTTGDDLRSIFARSVFNFMHIFIHPEDSVAVHLWWLYAIRQRLSSYSTKCRIISRMGYARTIKITTTITYDLIYGMPEELISIYVPDVEEMTQECPLPPGFVGQAQSAIHSE